MASKWDDEFDLDDEYDKKKPRKEDNKKNRQSITNNDYQDLEDDNRNLKLPTISKNINIPTEKNAKSTSNLNLQQINKKKGEATINNKKQKDEDQEYQFEQSLAPNPSSLKKKSPPKNDNKKINEPTSKYVQEQNYGNQQFQQDKYEQDFEEHQQKKLSPVGYKPKQQPRITPKTVNIPKPLQKSRKGAESVAKKTEISVKANSRNSVRSQSASRVVNSNLKQQKKEDPPNKYTSLAQKTCPNYQRSTLSDFSSDKLVRENDKIRGMIKKLNDELNDLINKNIMQLKNKKEEKVVLADDILKVLEQQKNSNETAYQTTAKELQRLKGKQGQVRQEEFLISLDQKIGETKSSLTQYAKNITKLKLQVANEGNKLAKIDKQTNNTQQINNLKNNYLLIKKEEQKNDQVLQKLYIKIQELTKKNAQVDAKYNDQIESAKSKGFSVQINPELVKKSQQAKKKIQNIRSHKSKTQNLYKTKCDMVIHQCDQIKTQIKSIENTITTCNNNCDEIQNEIKKIIQKAKKNPKLSQQMISTLQSIIYQLQSNTPSSNKNKQDVNSLSYPKGAKKYQSQKNVQKIQVAVSREEKQKTEDDINLKKPNLFKKKEKQDQKQDQRVWKDDKNAEPKKPQKIPFVNPISQLAKFENKQQGEKKDDQKKKPFVIKKNKEVKQEVQNLPEIVKQQVKIEKIQIKKQPQKNQQIPNIAPRMMKFRKSKEEAIKIQDPIKIQQPVQKPALKIIEKEPQKVVVQQQIQKPIFAPKRFQLRQKEKTNEEPGYLASITQRKQQVKIVEQFKPKGLAIEKDPVIEIKTEPLKATQQKITINEEEQKLKFNLRLKDRQRESNKLQTKIENPIPIEPTKQSEQKISINLNDKSKQNNNQYVNPYALNAASNDPPKRERQGPLKKQKPTQNIQKPNFNIYDQAQDITNVKQIKIGQQSPSKQKLPVSKQSEQPNLQQLLGIKKNKNTIDEDLIVDTKILGNKKNKQKKKDTNFFGDLQI